MVGRVFVLLLALGLPATRGESMEGASGKPLKLRFSTIDAIDVWAARVYFGHEKHHFTRGDQSVLVLVGSPTSGLVTSEIAVFSRVADGTYELMLIRNIFPGEVTVAEVQGGIEFYTGRGAQRNRGKLLLMIPWTGVFLTAMK